MKESKEVSQKLKKETKTPWGLYAKITALLTVVGIVTMLASTYIPHPTQAHREVSSQLTKLEARGFSEGFDSKVYDSKEYKELFSSPETKYTTAAIMILGLIDLVITVVLVGVTYNYLRKNHISRTRRALGATVMTNLISGMIAWIVTLPAVAAITATPMPDLGMIAITLVLYIFTGLIILYLITRIFEWRYDRKHSFIVE